MFLLWELSLNIKQVEVVFPTEETIVRSIITYSKLKPSLSLHLSFESSEKKKLLLAQFAVKFVMLPAQSIVQANWFACLPACMSPIVRVSLTSLSYIKAMFNKTIIIFIIRATIHLTSWSSISHWRNYSKIHYKI